MPYIGRELERGTYLKLDDISSSFDGNKTIFNLTKGGDSFFPGSPQSIIVSLNGTILEPVTQYGIDSSKIVFGTAPTAGHSFFSITLGLPFGVFDNGSIEDGSLTGVKLSNPFNYDGGLLYLNSITDRVGIRTENPTHDLDIHGDVRIVGILTVGTSSLVLDGSNNKIQVGTALTLSHSDGAIIGNSHLHSTGYDLKDDAKIKLGDDGDLEIFHTNTYSAIKDVGTGNLLIGGSEVHIRNSVLNENCAKFISNGAVELYHGMAGASAEKKFETSTTGATVTGKLVITGDLDVQGTTTTLDTTLTEVDKLEVGANNTTVGVAITQSGTGDALTIDDGTSRVLTVKDGGNVGIGTDNPLSLLTLGASANPTLEFKDFTNNARALIAGGANGQLVFQTDVGAVNANSDFIFRANSATNEIVRFKGDSGYVGIGTNSPKMQLHAYNSTPSDTGGILVSNVNYSANQDKPYLIVGTKGWTGAATNWNTFGFQHKIKVNSGGVPKLTIDGLTGGTVQELFTFKGSKLGIGVTEPTGKLHLPDSGEIRLGNDGDLKILHNGSNGVIGNVTGDLYIQANHDGDVGGDIYIRAKIGENSIFCDGAGAVYLYNDNNLRFNTNGQGINVTGPDSGTGVGIGTTADHDPLILAQFKNTVSNVSKFRILSKRDTDGTDWTTSYTRIQQRIDVTDQGYIQFNGSDNNYGMEFGTKDDEKFAKFIRNGAVELYHDNGQRFNTTAQGINVTTVGDVPQVSIAQTTTTAFSVNGTVSFVNANNTTAQIQGRTGAATTTGDLIFLCNTVGDESLAILEDGKVRVPDRGKFVAGTGNDLEIFHNTSGSANYNEIQSNNGNMRIRNYDTSAAGKYLYVQSENVSIRSHTNNHNMINAFANAQVDLYHNNTLRLSTTDTGVSITNNLNVAGITTSATIKIKQNQPFLQFFDTNAAADNQKWNFYCNASQKFVIQVTNDAGSGGGNLFLFTRSGTQITTFEAQKSGVTWLTVDNPNRKLTTRDLDVTNNLDVDGATTLDGLTVSEAATFSADVNVGDGSADARILIKKADNNEADHIQFYNGTSRVGEIGCLDGTWLRINQETNKNIYTPRYIRADSGFFVDDTTKGINGSGNFIGGTIAGASDYDTLLRSDTNDTMNGELTVGGSAVSGNEGGQINVTLAPNSTLNGSVIIDQYIDQLRFFEGSGETARGATIIFTHLSGNTDNEIFSSGLTGVGYTVTHLRSFGIPNGVVAISTSTQSHIPLTVTNSGGFAADTTIAKFVGDSDSLEIRNISAGDYQIRNSQQNNGISIFDGTAGVALYYNDSRKFSAIDGGLSVNDELTFENDDEGVTTYDGGRFYKKSGGGIAIRQTSGNQTPIIENNAGTLQGTILHTASVVEVTGNMKFSGDGLQMSDHYYHGYYDTTNRRNYIHLYPTETSDRGTGASQTDIRAWTGSTFRTLVIKGDADPTWDGNKIIHAGNASTDLTQFLRSDTSDTATGRITLTNSNTYPLTIDGTSNAKIVLAGSSNPYIRFREGSTDRAYIQFHSTNGFQLVNEESSESFRIQSGSDGLKFVHDGTTSNVIHTGNASSNLTQFVRSDTADTMTGNLTMDGNVILDTGHVVQHHATATRDKYRVWSESVYAIGMDDAMSFGGLNDYAMTFQMNNDTDRGWVFLDNNHSDSQGAMSLTTNGKMCVADSLRLGFGQSDTTTPGTNSTLDVSGQIKSSSTIEAGRGGGAVALTLNDGYGNANIAFNHTAGVPDNTDTTQSSGRIECSVDSDTANMYFELWDSTTNNTATGDAGTTGGAGQNGIQMQLSTTEAKIHPFLILNSSMRLNASGGEIEFNTGGPRLRVTATNQLSFYSGGGLNSGSDERMRIGSDGVVTMYNDLVVSAPSTSNVTRLHGGSIELNRTANDAFIDFKTTTSEDFDCRIQKSSNQLVFYTGGNGSNQITVNMKGNGDVDIPNGKLYVAEEVFFRSEFNLQGATTEATKHMDIGFEGHGFSMRRTTYDDQNHDVFLSVNSSGAVTLQTNIGTTSDAKLKKNITTISDGAIENIKKLRPVKFDWIKNDKLNDNNGFIAQEVKEIFPNLVYGTEYDPTLIDEEKGTKGGIKSEGYSIDLVGISANLTKALQEAITKIETLEAEVTALKAKVG